jgi:hypothetical protein
MEPSEPGTDTGDGMTIDLSVEVTDEVSLLGSLDRRCSADTGPDRAVEGPITCTLDVPAEGESAMVSIVLAVGGEDEVAEVTAALEGQEFGTDTTPLAPPVGTTALSPGDPTASIPG